MDRCPNCKTLTAEIKGKYFELEVGASAYCPACGWNFKWDGKQWVAGDRDAYWWHRVSRAS